MEPRKAVVLEVGCATGHALRQRSALQSQGWLVVVVREPAEPAEVAEQAFRLPANLVVVHAEPGRLDPVAVARALNASAGKTGEGPQLLVLLPAPSLEDTLRVLEAGADECLAQPVHPAELVARAKRSLRARWRSREAVHALELQAVRELLGQLRLELNNPLCVLQAGAELLERRLVEEPSTARFAALATSMRRSVEDLHGKLERLAEIGGRIQEPPPTTSGPPGQWPPPVGGR